MSSDKNPEVVGCDASIMKNVWEIRSREYEQKMQHEQERIEKSALPSINRDWENRMTTRLGKYRRVEKKTKSAESSTDDNNVWKSKKTQVPPTLPRGRGPIGKPGGLNSGFSTQAPSYNYKKGKDNKFKRLHLLLFISQTQPSALVWGKSWKNNKSLPSPVEGTATRSDWGQCWMFATPQPYSEAGKPWPNGPNKMNPNSLHLGNKPHYRVIETQDLDLELPSEEWQMSWRKSDKNNEEDTGSMNDKNVHRSGYNTMLEETTHQNKTMCSSEWSESWRSIKAANQQEHFNVSNNGLINQSFVNKQCKNSEMISIWEECWKLVNHHGCNKFQLPQIQQSLSPEWSDSWKAASMVFQNNRNSDPTLRQEPSDSYDSIHQNNSLSCKQKFSDLYFQLYNEFKVPTEWSKSWQVTKNNSKPSEEIENVLKAPPPRIATALETQQEEKDDSCYDQLNHNIIHNNNNNIIYQSKTELTKSKLLLFLQKNIENVLIYSEWKDSWKTLKHRTERMERRRMRRLRESERGEDMKPTSSEWKNSWKFTCQTRHQDPELWQRGWSTTPQMRADRAVEQNHFVPTEVRQNGPTAEQSWAESRRFSRRQQRPNQDTAQSSQGRPSMVYHHPNESQFQRRSYIRSVSDWQEAWMVSESEFHHDKPSLTQWREAWRWSIFHTDHWTEQVQVQENWVDELLEIQPLRDIISLQRAKAEMSRSFNSQVFRERYPEKQWSVSWKAGSFHCGSSGMPRKNISNSTQQQCATASEHGSKWGRSFRLANPMPNMKQSWVESSPNLCRYAVMWPRGNNIKNTLNTNFSNNPTCFRHWGKSHEFLQGGKVQIKGKSRSKEPIDPRVIMTKTIQIRRHLYSNNEKEKQTGKWAGCHLLGKTQPRPKKNQGSVKKIKVEDETKNKFLEEWAQSWMFMVQPSNLKKQMKSLSGWVESWKFLFPPYQPMNDPKAN